MLYSYHLHAIMEDFYVVRNTKTEKMFFIILLVFPPLYGLDDVQATLHPNMLDDTSSSS